MYRTLECAGGITINIESFEDSVLSVTILVMHYSHLHSVDILLVCMCMRVSAFARLVTFFIIILCGGTYVCVPASTYTVRETYYCHLMKNAFCHCSLIISSHVPVNENMKYLS